MARASAATRQEAEKKKKALTTIWLGQSGAPREDVSARKLRTSGGGLLLPTKVPRSSPVQQHECRGDGKNKIRSQLARPAGTRMHSPMAGTAWQPRPNGWPHLRPRASRETARVRRALRALPPRGIRRHHPRGPRQIPRPVTDPHLPDRWVGGLDRPPPPPPRRSLPSSPRPRLGRPFSIPLHPPSRRAGASAPHPWRRSPSTGWQ